MWPHKEFILDERLVTDERGGRRTLVWSLGVVAVFLVVLVGGVVLGGRSGGSEPYHDPDFSCQSAMWDIMYDSYRGSPHPMLTDEQKDLGFDLQVARNRLMVLEGYTDHQAHMALLPYVLEACDG